MAVVRDCHCKEWATGTETPSTHVGTHAPSLTLEPPPFLPPERCRQRGTDPTCAEPRGHPLHGCRSPSLPLHGTAPHVALFQENWRSPHSPPYCAHTLHLFGPTHPRACFQCVVSRTRRKCLAPLSCVRSLAHRSPLLTLLLCIRRRPLQHRFASRDEFTAMKEDGRLKFGQVPALAVTTGGKTTIINQRWVGRVRVVCVCVCVRRCSVHSPEVGAIIRRV